MMQIAKGIVIAGKDLEIPKTNVTPAEALVLHKLFYQNAQGRPLRDFEILPGEAVTETGHRKEKVRRKNLEGVEVEAEISVPITRPRTAQEEIARLRRAYPGTVKDESGKSAPVVNVCFPGQIKHLPMTFEELEGNVTGIEPGFFKRLETSAPEPESPAIDEDKFAELMERGVEELRELAKGMGLEIGPKEKKAGIAKKILAKAAETPSAAT